MAVLAEVPAPDTVVVYGKRRMAELLLLVLAQSLGLSGWFVTYLNQYNKLPSNWIPATIVWFGLGLAAHLVIRWRTPWADPIMLPSVFLLNGLGIAMIARIDQFSNPPREEAAVQLMWTGLGVVLFCLILVVLRDHRVLGRFKYLLFLLGFTMLMLPLLPGLGVERGGARIWIEIAGYSLQPAEFAKVVLAFAFAAYLNERKDLLALAGKRFLGIDLPRPRDLVPLLLMWGASLVILVTQKDLGTSLMFFGLFSVMLYVATERPSWPILAGLLIVAGAIGAYYATAHFKVRVNGWLDPFGNFDQNEQLIQAQFGMAWGGLSGRGWGLGRPYLTPISKSDFMVASLGEELGLVALFAITLVYAIIVMRGLRAALTCRDGFGKLLACGLAFVVGLQVFTIVGGVTRLLPLTGQNAPFMSQGGSSLVANWAMLGVLMVISHAGRRPQLNPPADPVVDLLDDHTRVLS
ncbi:MAG: FtsW/RodA/SpoVE family cell cycle protein [Propionibacteriaceae bacterium]|nr:FtsW/RodA/SpoVE family cell cycle protein [Propionibacteriaceae bacterium]